MKGQSSFFPEFDFLRIQIAEAASQNKAIHYCGQILGDRRDVGGAIAVNSAILTCPTLPAVERYNGLLYNRLGETAISKLKGGKVTNLLILSALHGPTSPRDLLPNYDLMMQDSIQNESLSSKWLNAVKQNGARLPEFVGGFERCVAAVSRYYESVAKQIADAAFLPFFPLAFKNSAGTNRTGRLLSGILSEIG
jgi:hypothetical protein